MAVNIPQSMHLQFGPWLMTQISSGKYIGLEWLDEEKMTMFKIPWTKINYPMWEEHHKIFEAWAMHRESLGCRKGVMDQTYSQIKSNFRTILRKCIEIEEVEDCHQLGLQMGNYKVYRVLSREESIKKRKMLLEKKKLTMRKYRPLTKKASISQQPFNNDNSSAVSYGDAKRKVYKVVSEVTVPLRTGKCAKIRRKEELLNDQLHTNCLDTHNDVRRTTSTQTAATVNDHYQYLLEPAAFEETEDVDMESGDLTTSASALLASPHSQNAGEATRLPVKRELADHNYAATPLSDIHGFQMLLDAAQIAENFPSHDNESYNTTLMLEVVKQEKSPPSIVDVLVELKIPPEELFTFVMHVRYEAHSVMQNIELNDMRYGYRIHYVNHQARGKKVLQKRQELKEDIDRTPVTLPQSDVSPGSSLYTVLKNIDVGLVVKSDSRYTMTAKRLCMSRIFAFTAFGEVDTDVEPTSLVRNAETVLFSYDKFLRAWHRFLVDGSPKPNPEINLAFGKKIKHRHNRGFVTVTLIPKAADTMLKHLSKKMDESTLNNLLGLFNSKSS